MAAFARRRGYQPGRLEYWRRQERAAPAENAIGLAPVVITGSSRAPLVIALANDVRLEIDDPSTVHPAWVAELAAAVRKGAST